jgi:hypothetical protein
MGESLHEQRHSEEDQRDRKHDDRPWIKVMSQALHEQSPDAAAGNFLTG